MNQLRVLAFAALFAGCQYDFDKLYEHPIPDAGHDQHDSGPMLASNALIKHWIGTVPTVNQACITCAETKCAQDNTDCNADPTCVQYTECVAKDPTPAGQMTCRHQFSQWVNADKQRERDLNGPYGQCVFRYSCSQECTGDSELWCNGMYTMPKTSDLTVPLHLYLLDAFNLKPLANATVRACSAQNPRECTDTRDAMGTTDAKGLVNLQLPSSYSGAFTGYLEIAGAARYPTLLKFSWNIGQESTLVVSIVSQEDFQLAIDGIFSADGNRPDDARGMLQLRMLGCQGAGVQGVHFAMTPPDSKARTWYIVSGVPKLDATETTPVGSGGIIDVSEGTTNVTALTADNTLVGKVDAPVRAKFMTVVVYAPLARQ